MENYCLPGHFSELYNTEIIVNKALPLSAGDYGIVYLGDTDSHLTVENCTVKNADLGGIFLSEFASNVVLNNNVFVDNKYQVYAIYLNQYNLEPVYDNIRITNNTFISENRSKIYGVFSYVSEFGNNLEITGNQFLTGSAFSYPTEPGGTAIRVNPDAKPGHFVIENNTFDNWWLVPPRFDEGSESHYRAEWRNNVFSGHSFDGQSIVFDAYSTDPILVHPSAPRYTITGVGASRLKARDKEVVIGDIDKLPDGFVITLNVGQASNLGYGVEIKPASWNNLDRGYMVYFDNSIEFIKGPDGSLQLLNFSPRPGSSPTITAVTIIAVDGYQSITLNPTSETIYDSFRGIPEGFPVLLHVNELVRFASSATVSTPGGGIYDPDESQPLYIIKGADGILRFQMSPVSSDPMLIAPEAPAITIE